MVPIKISAKLPEAKIVEFINAYNSKNNLKIKYIKENENSSMTIEKMHLDEEVFYDNLTTLVFNIINKFYMNEIISYKISKITNNYQEYNIGSLNDRVNEMLLDKYNFPVEKSKIKADLKRYLVENNTLIIDGYLRFRSEKYEELLDLILEKVILDLELELEYDEFIYILQYYLSSQVSRYDLVNVIINGDEFYILDNNKNIIEDSITQSKIRELDLYEFSKADILVSTLIMISPEKIIVHIRNDKEKDLLIILRKIFEDRLKFCYSCNLCDNNLLNIDND